MGTSASPSMSATCSDGIFFCVMVGFPYGPENLRSPGELPHRPLSDLDFPLIRPHPPTPAFWR
jgi:hypothetical protein